MRRPSLPARTWVALASGPAVYLVGRLLSLWPPLLETGFARGLGAWLSWPLSRVSGLFPISLAELLLVLFVGWSLGRLVRPWVRRAAPLRERLRNFGHEFVSLLARLSVVWALFSLLWGWHYERAPLPDRWGWPEPNAEIVDDRLASLSRELVDRTNAAYLALHGVEDAGTPTTASATDRHRLEAALDEAFARLGVAESRPAAFGWPWGQAKSLRISPFLHRLGLSGFYFPWTAEANLNADVPACSAAHVRAHEKSHQRGIARENEANFVAALVGMMADDPWAQYSAALFAQRQALSELFRRDPALAQELLLARLPGVQRDVDDLRAYWDRYRGAWRKTARTVNHAYLRSQGVEGGIASYRGSLRLLLHFAVDHELPRSRTP